MGLENLKPAEGSTRQIKRLGRGQGSGQGKTAGKGHKGQRRPYAQPNANDTTRFPLEPRAWHDSEGHSPRSLKYIRPSH